MAVHVNKNVLKITQSTHIILKRFYKKNIVRVRFAPSPTGMLELLLKNELFIIKLFN